MQGLCLVPSPSLGKAAEVLGASSTLSLVCFPWQQIALCYPHVSHTQLLVGAGVGGGFSSVLFWGGTWWQGASTWLGKKSYFPEDCFSEQSALPLVKDLSPPRRV